jgi:hypothetical protein
VTKPEHERPRGKFIDLLPTLRPDSATDAQFPAIAPNVLARGQGDTGFHDYEHRLLHISSTTKRARELRNTGWRPRRDLNPCYRRESGMAKRNSKKPQEHGRTGWRSRSGKKHLIVSPTCPRTFEGLPFPSSPEEKKRNGCAPQHLLNRRRNDRAQPFRPSSTRTYYYLRVCGRLPSTRKYVQAGSIMGWNHGLVSARTVGGESRSLPLAEPKGLR